MLLYDCATAPSPRRARMFIAEKGLAEKGVDVQLEQVDLAGLGNLEADYLAKVPTGTVPALLTDEGELITENLAIAAYLERLHPKPPLMGRDALEAARILEWDMRITLGAFLACAEMIRNSSPRMVDRALPGPRPVKQIPELAARGRARIAGFWDDFDAHLAGRDFVASGGYSYADITGTVCVDFSAWCKASPLETHPNIVAWHARMRARPNYDA